MKELEVGYQRSHWGERPAVSTFREKPHPAAQYLEEALAALTGADSIMLA